MTSITRLAALAADGRTPRRAASASGYTTYMSRRAIITGASGGLGVVVSKAFAEAGWDVAGLDRGSGADLSQADTARAAVDAAVAKLGGLDAVIHLVGGFTLGSMAEAGDDSWARMWTLNFQSALYVMRSSVAALTANCGGAIVVIGSKAGLEPSPGLTPYAVSKAALHALVQCAAAELSGTGITVNAVLPSTIDTPANRAAMPDADPARWVKPEHIASLLLWMASPAGRDMSGALVPLTGEA